MLTFINYNIVLPIGKIPEGTIIFNIEEYTGDRGTLSRCSGSYALIIGHSEDGLSTRIRLPRVCEEIFSAKYDFSDIWYVRQKSKSPTKNGDNE